MRTLFYTPFDLRIATAFVLAFNLLALMYFTIILFVWWFTYRRKQSLTDYLLNSFDSPVLLEIVAGFTLLLDLLYVLVRLSVYIYEHWL